MRPCFTFISAAANKPGNLSIYDEIGFWGTQAKDFQTGLSAIAAKDIHVEISSPGGDYFAGLAMYNMLRNSGKTITTKVMGVAASAATVVFAAGDVREMPKNTMLMVHNPSNPYGGTAQDHRETADMLDKIAVGARSVYVRNSTLTDEEVAAMLEKDTWISADEALEMGLATVVTDEITATASFDMDRADLPAGVRAVYMAAKGTPPAVVPPKETVEPPVDEPAFADAALVTATAAGFEAHAPGWVLACTTLAQVNERIASAKQITSLCAVVKQPEMAVDFIKGNKSIVEARAALVELAAKADEDSHVDTSPKQKQQSDRSNAKPKVSTASLWASHNAQSKK